MSAMPMAVMVYFKDGGWVIGRFSGTEPLLRIFCEMPTLEEARAVTGRMEKFLEFKASVKYAEVKICGTAQKAAPLFFFP